MLIINIVRSIWDIWSEILFYVVYSDVRELFSGFNNFFEWVIVCFSWFDICCVWLRFF